MTSSNLMVLHINTVDILGGAERVGWTLFNTYRTRGIASKYVVGTKNSTDPDVVALKHDNYRSPWTNFWLELGDKLSPWVSKIRGVWQFQTFLYGIGRPKWWIDVQQGIEDFEFPATRYVFDLMDRRPDIIHCHNLHGNYFDLQALTWLSHKIPTVITLHDMWLFTGHCAHSFDCDRWKHGCGKCPYLDTYPAIVRDATKRNWMRKSLIFTRSRLNIATPSQWLMDQVEQSMLNPVIEKKRVIHNGVDTSIFCPIDKQLACQKLGLSPNAHILLFAASGIRQNKWKDFQTLYSAIVMLNNEARGQEIIFLALGEDAPSERIGNVTIQFVPYQKLPEKVALYYQAADIYLHAARAEVWGLTVTEALACGTPVVATNVGGISEQIKSLNLPGVSGGDFDMIEATGVLVPERNAVAMARAVQYLLSNKLLMEQLGRNAAADAGQRFSLDKQADAYLNWYMEILEQREKEIPQF